MRFIAKALLAIFCLGFTGFFGATPARAQLLQALMSEVALKSGETVDLGDIMWTINCQSFLKSLPVVEILDGPPEVTAAIKEKMVLPRFKECAKRISGGNLTLTAGEIVEQSHTKLVLRIKYMTREGPRERSRSLALVLVP